MQSGRERRHPGLGPARRQRHARHYVGTTVTMFERVLPSEIASILAIPRASAVTSPELETDTTPAGELCYVTTNPPGSPRSSCHGALPLARVQIVKLIARKREFLRDRCRTEYGPAAGQVPLRIRS